MSCGIVLAAALLLSDPNVALAAARPPVAADAPVSVASEPLFADIVARSSALKAVVDGWNGAPSDFSGFRVRASELAALDLQAHLILKQRGTDSDLTCILRGIAEDMPLKVDAVATAVSPEARAAAISDLSYLLNDNVEVITAPPGPAT